MRNETQGRPPVALLHGKQQAYWIPSVAWIRMDEGIVSPRALAALRLRTGSNRGGCLKGRPAVALDVRLAEALEPAHSKARMGAAAANCQA